jgi:hypothetical protein
MKYRNETVSIIDHYKGGAVYLNTTGDYSNIDQDVYSETSEGIWSHFHRSGLSFGPVTGGITQQNLETLVAQAGHMPITSPDGWVAGAYTIPSYGNVFAEVYEGLWQDNLGSWAADAGIQYFVSTYGGTADWGIAANGEWEFSVVNGNLGFDTSGNPADKIDFGTAEATHTTTYNTPIEFVGGYLIYDQAGHHHEYRELSEGYWEYFWERGAEWVARDESSIETQVLRLKTDNIDYEFSRGIEEHPGITTIAINNQDGINISDAIDVLRHIVSLEPLTENSSAYHSADVNNDNEVNISDAISILRHIVDIDSIDTYKVIDDQGNEVSKAVVDSTEVMQDNWHVITIGDVDMSGTTEDLVIATMDFL